MSQKRILVAVIAVSAVLYLALLAGVATSAPWMQGLDDAVQAIVFPLRSSALTPAIAFTTDLSDTVPCLVVGAAMLVYLLATRRFRAAGLYAGTLATAEVLVEGTKFLLARPRPHGMNLVEFPWNASFPSGHTFVAIVAVGFAVFVLVKLHPQWPKGSRVALAAVAVAWVVYIGFTRIYLGVHWPTDVLGSLLLCGGVVLPAAALLWRRVIPK